MDRTPSMLAEHGFARARRHSTAQSPRKRLLTSTGRHTEFDTGNHGRRRARDIYGRADSGRANRMRDRSGVLITAVRDGPSE